MFPFRSTMLHEKSQLQDLNYRLESYLARVRQLEKENQLLTTEIEHSRREGRTEGNNAYVEEIKKMRWELEELVFENAKAEMQRHNLWQEIQELQNHHNTEQTACKNISRELAEHQKALQQTETANATLEEYIFEIQGECQILEAQHERAKREMREKIRRPPQALVTRGYYTAPVTEEDLENYAHAFSEMWQESFEIYKSKIEELETAVQQDKERGEEINEERVLLIREIEALRKEFGDQCNLQNQLEDDFLTFEQKRDVDVKEYQMVIELLEDEKQHLASVITLNLKEQQRLMQVKMGLSLELATYRALLEAEHAKHQGLEEQLRKSRQGADTRSRTHGIVVRPTRDILDGKKWKPINIDIPSSFRRDTVIIKKGTTPKPGPSRISTRKITDSSFSNGDLLCTDDKLSSSVQNVASSARPINAYRDVTRFTPTLYDPYSTMKEAQVQHKVFPEKIDPKSKVLSRGAEHVAEVATHKSMIRVKESVDDNESDVSYYEDYKVKSQSSNELPQSFSEVQDYEFNRSTEPTKEEEYERQPSKGVIIVQHAPKEVEFKVDLGNVWPHITPDRYIRTTEHEAGGEITSMNFQSDNITEKNKEEPTMEAVEEIWTKTSVEEPNDKQAIIISKEETLTSNIRIGDIIQTVIKPTDLEKMNVSPESAITYHIEKEVLDDGTTKTEIPIQSRREETVDVADEWTLQEVLNKDVKSSELQLKGALEHLTGSKTDSFIDGLLSPGFKGREAPGKVSVNFEVSEQTSERSAEADDSSMPADTISLSLGTPLGTEENDHEGIDDNYEEILNITMTAEDFRKTMLSNTEPVLHKFTESSTSFSSSNEKAQEIVKEEAELFGINETKMRLQNLQDNEGTENFEQTKVIQQDSLSKELSAPRIIEESIKVPQDVQASIVQLLNKEMEDPKLKLKGALEQLKGAMPENLRDELSILTRDIQEGSDNVSINIKNVQQSSQSGVVTIEAEVNVSQSLDPEDFYSMEQYNENKDEIGSGLKFLNTQQQIQELLSGKGLETVDALNDEGGIKVKVGGNKGQLMALPETSARDVEDADAYTSSQDHTRGVTVHEMTQSSEMEGDLYDQSAWFQTATSKMYGEEFIHRISDPVDSSVTLHTNVNRIMSMNTTGGDKGGMAFITQQEEVAEGTAGERLDDNVYWYEEWESGSRGVNEMGVTDAVGEKDLQASDSELMQYSASPNVLTTRRIVVSEGITQVGHGEQKVVVSLDEDQSDDFPQSDDEL